MNNYKVPNYELLMKEYNDKLSNTEEIWVHLEYPMIKKGYRISNHGRVKTLNGRLKKLICKSHDQTYVQLRTTTKHGTHVNVAKLVAANFIKIDQKLIDDGENVLTLKVMHHNKINCCNAAFNLEWCTTEQYYEFMKEFFQTSNNILSPEQVKEICTYLKGDFSIPEIKNLMKLNMSDIAISNINNRKSWSNVSSDFDLKPRCVRYSDELIHALCKDLQDGMNIRDVNIKYNISIPYINCIRKKKCRVDIASQYNFETNKARPCKKRFIDEDRIRSICEDIASGLYTIAEIAKRHNEAYGCVHRIRNRISHINISSEYDFSKCPIGRNTISDDILLDVCKEIKKGTNVATISSTYKVSQSLVRMIKNGEVHKELFDNCEV